MSRSISVWYRLKEEVIDIDVGNHDLLGTQGPSYRFWSQKELKAFGLSQLVILIKLILCGSLGGRIYAFWKKKFYY